MIAYDITMRHGSVPKGLDYFIAERLERLEKYLRESSRVEFVLEKDHEVFRCEAIVHDQRRGSNIVVHESHEEIHASLDGVLEKMRSVLVKRKDRRKDHHRGHGIGEELSASPPGSEEEGSDEPSYEDIVNKEVKGE